MPIPRRGEVWLIDFGFAGKTRPALILSVAFGDQDRSLVTVVPHTTALRGSQFEIAIRAPFLKPGAFLVQGITTFPTVNALHKLGTLAPESLQTVLDGVLRWLGHPPEA
jgi:mRNA interferase MazF